MQPLVNTRLAFDIRESRTRGAVGLEPTRLGLYQLSYAPRAAS